jgi:hypothetical protein
MGAYDWGFQFDDLQVDTHTTSGQRVFTVDSSIECRCDKICCVGNFGNHYQKHCRKDVVSTSSQNHEATYDAIYRSGEPLHSNGTTQCSHAKGRMESFLVEGEVCRSTFGLDSSYLDEGELWNVCQQKAHVFGGPC